MLHNEQKIDSFQDLDFFFPLLISGIGLKRRFLNCHLDEDILNDIGT